MQEESKLQYRMQTAAVCFLLLGLIAYPFSIAGSSLFFGLLVFMALLQFKVIQQGFKIIWTEYKEISVALLLLFSITILGYFWSDNSEIALHKIKKQLNWLVLPAILGLVFYVPNLRKKAFIALSVGLFLHLIVCIFQYYGVITISGQGSSSHDATGYIGHLTFGFIYAIWAGALVVASQQMTWRWRFLCYVIVLYAVTTIFLAQGRSGYILTFSILILVIWKVTFLNQTKFKVLALLIFTLGVTSLFVMHKPSYSKLEKSWSGIEAFMNSDWQHVDERFKVWATGFEIWRQNPWFGIGTGDYYDESIALLAKPEYKHLQQITAYYHPHNEFLFALTRWGPIGLLIFSYLCWVWLRTGWKKDWENDTMNAYLCTSSGLAVIIHGLTEVSLNSKLPLVFAILILAFSMSREQEKK